MGSNLGFAVQRRTGNVQEFTDLKTYEDFQPLASQGPQGGSYSFIDDTVEPGKTYLYRIMDCDEMGGRNFVDQCGVDIITEKEKFGAIISVAVAVLTFGAAF